MNRYLVYFEGKHYNGSLHAPNIDTAMDRAIEKYDFEIVTHIEEC